MSAAPKILIIHANEHEIHDLKVILDFLGEDVSLVSSCQAAKADIQNHALLSIILGSDDPTLLSQSLTEIYAAGFTTPVILLKESSFLDKISEPYCRIVLGHFEMPLKYTQVLNMLHRAQAFRENMRAEVDAIRPVELFRSLIGTSSGIQTVREAMSRVSATEVNVLILGESGTGKEVVARNIHYHSNRRAMPFVPVNCGAIPTELLESELFGHEKGAFTGAVAARAGRFEMAQGGTLFLDEIGDMPQFMQVKLLRVLQERTFERVGSNKSLQANVRIISATHRNLEKAIREGTFREDLYYRLNVFPIEMPSLKERKEDIPFLINDLISRIESDNRGSIRLSVEAVETLCQYHWPGNVRELANLIERLIVMTPHGIIDAIDLPQKFKLHESDILSHILKSNPDPKKPAPRKKGELEHREPFLPEQGMDLKDHLSLLELQYIRQALEQANGVVTKAAHFLNLRRTTLIEKMKKYGLTEAEEKAS